MVFAGRARRESACRAGGASAGQVDLSQWPALVLTAGLATRLQPLSSVRAKAALPVAGEALITRILRWLHAAGIRRVVLNLHHRADSITRIVGDGSRLDLVGALFVGNRGPRLGRRARRAPSRCSNPIAS